MSVGHDNLREEREGGGEEEREGGGGLTFLISLTLSIAPFFPE